MNHEIWQMDLFQWKRDPFQELFQQRNGVLATGEHGIKRGVFVG